MKSHRTIALLVLALAATACSRGRQLVAPAATLRARESATTAAHMRLQGALNDQDSVDLAAVLRPDVQLIAPTGDTLRGPLVLRYFMYVAADRSRRYRFAPGSMESCADGSVYEYDGDLSGPPRSGTVLTGRYAILWAADENWATVREIRLAAERTTLRSALPCESEYANAAKLHRFTASLTAETNAGGASGSIQDVEHVMRSRGFAYHAQAATGPAASAFPQRQLPHGSVLAGLRYRLDPMWSSELQVAFGMRETVSGFDSVRSRYVELSSAPLRLAALAQYQRGPLRLGVGPAVLIGNWTTHEDARTLEFQTLSVGGLPIGDPRYLAYQDSFWRMNSGVQPSVASASAPSVGVASDLALMFSMSRSLLAELHAGAAIFSSASLPSTPGFSSASAAARHIGVGVSLAMGWQ
jgi:hypothetical protein